MVTSAGLLVTVLATALVAHALAPASWRALAARQLPDRASLVVGIFVNNLLVAVTPMLGGWLAARHRQRGHAFAVCVVSAVAVVVVARSVLVIGIVGGLDTRWLFEASRWWTLELTALGVSAGTGRWLLRHPERRLVDGVVAVRRAMTAVTVCLAAAALVEVFTA